MIYLLVLTFIVICMAIHEYEHKDSGYYEPIEKNKENKMNEKLNIDLNRVAYDGRSFRLIVKDEKALLLKLKEKQKEILEDLGLEIEEIDLK